MQAATSLLSAGIWALQDQGRSRCQTLMLEVFPAASALQPKYAPYLHVGVLGNERDAQNNDIMLGLCKTQGRLYKSRL